MAATSPSTSTTKVEEKVAAPSTTEAAKPSSAAEDVGDKAETGSIPDPGEVPIDAEGIIDESVLEQIRDMDEADDDDADSDADPREFSRGIVWGFFDQAEHTFTEMGEALAAKDLPKLSSLGHFLKGSSAALGIVKVQSICEKVQHYGHNRDEEANEDLTEEEALARIKSLLTQCKKDYAVAKGWLVRLYEEEGK